MMRKCCDGELHGCNPVPLPPNNRTVVNRSVIDAKTAEIELLRQQLTEARACLEIADKKAINLRDVIMVLPFYGCPNHNNPESWDGLWSCPCGTDAANAKLRQVRNLVEGK